MLPGNYRFSKDSSVAREVDLSRATWLNICALSIQLLKTIVSLEHDPVKSGNKGRVGRSHGVWLWESATDAGALQNSIVSFRRWLDTQIMHINNKMVAKKHLGHILLQNIYIVKRDGNGNGSGNDDGIVWKLLYFF